MKKGEPKGVFEVMEKLKRVHIRPGGFIESKSIQTSITIFSSSFIHKLKRFVEKTEQPVFLAYLPIG